MAEKIRHPSAKRKINKADYFLSYIQRLTQKFKIIKHIGKNTGVNLYDSIFAIVSYVWHAKHKQQKKKYIS